MTPEQAEKFVTDQNAALAAKGRLLLTVDLSTPEQAGQIMQWMYGKDKPMAATLVSITWDCIPVPRAHAEALAALSAILGAPH